MVELTEGTPLRAVFSSRRKGEEPYLQVEAVGGDKLPAKVVEVVLYRHDVLGRDASSEAEWEIISINARPTDEPRAGYPPWPWLVIFSSCPAEPRPIIRPKNSPRRSFIGRGGQCGVSSFFITFNKRVDAKAFTLFYF